MPKTWGKIDFKQFEDFKKKLEKLEKTDADKFCSDAAKSLALRLLNRAIKRTPVDEGSLRRGWTATEHEDAVGGEELLGAVSYANQLPVKKVGDTYHITIYNAVNYASYVEFGHRKRGGKGWVRGQFMLTISEKEVQEIAPKILEQKLEKFLKGVFNDQ